MIALAELPEPVRQRVLIWAAAAVGEMPPGEIPTPLRPVARFAPAKRSRLGAATLVRELERDPGFRAVVGQVAERQQLDGRDAVGAAARGFLLRLPDAAALIEAAAAGAEEGQLRARIAELEQTVARLTDQLGRAAEETAQRQAAAVPGPEVEREVERLRQRLRDQGARLRTLQDQAAADARAAADRSDELRVERDAAVADAASWQRVAESALARAEAAAQTVQQLRRSAEADRGRADRRLELLLGTLEGAVAGLRREWDLTGGGPDPADEVAARLPAQSVDAERTTDPARLLAWLGLPRAHLIVDGYNVTKSGYPELSLADQRDRLIRALAALSARVSVELTVVFDGAAVTVAQPAGRGIRVLFSPPGVLADDVIRDLVAAEPAGRIIVVVSSDREVADAVSRNGARTADAASLLRVLGG